MQALILNEYLMEITITKLVHISIIMKILKEI